MVLKSANGAIFEIINLIKMLNMFKNISDIIIWSENYKKLANWYKE